MSLLIALDYDRTYTRDKEMWNLFITMCKQRKHRVICFTMRYHTSEKITDMGDVPIVYTERKAKKKYAEEAGYLVDIWIDDRPAWLFEDAL